MAAAIRLVDASRQYQLGSTVVKALKNINLEIGQGEFVALVGPSGSGKSTLLNLLGGLDKPTGGQIHVQDLRLQDATEEQLTSHRRHNVGFVFQTFNLLPRLTALENVALPLMLSGVNLAKRQERAQELLERVGLKPRLHHRPTEMSGGEQQRAAIARSLVNHPKLVLADEPTGNLDSSTGAEVMKLLREINAQQDVTLVVVTHDSEVAAYADRIIHLKDGEISSIEIVETGSRGPGEQSAAAPQPEVDGKTGLSANDLIRTALQNLKRRPVRNILTAAGVLIGIVTLVAMVSFGVGVQNEVKRNFEALGLENVFVTPLFPEDEDSLDPFGVPEPEHPITPEISAEFSAMPEVQSVTPVLSLPSNIEISLSHNGNSYPIRLSGVTGDGHPGPSGMSGPPVPVEVLAGFSLGEGETVGIVLSEGLAENMLAETGGSYEELVNQTVTLTVRLPRGETKDFTARIYGVRSGGNTRGIDLGIVERTAIKAWWYGRPDTLVTDGYDTLIIRAVDENAVPAVVAAAEAKNLEAQSLGAFLELANRVLAL
ncbi:MAG: ABC transporter ATP-binding protein/permease, partial [Anaerolineaceae bacterium]|nr:ABC transporter ATP-binding protein/permease [Anaerolineaceae bacterium]